MTTLIRSDYESRHGAQIYALGIAFLLILQLFMSVIMVFSGAKAGTPLYDSLSLASTIVFEVGFIGVFFLFNRLSRRTPSIGVKVKIKPIWYILGALFPIACYVFFYPAAFAFDVLLQHLGFKGVNSFKAGGTLQNILLIIATVIAAPVGEEIIFRCGLLSGLKKRFGDFMCAVLSGLAFAFMHMNPEQTVFQFFLGFGCAYLALSSGSVIPAIAAHAVNNAVAVIGTLAGSMPKGGAKNILSAVFVAPFEAYCKLLSSGWALAVLTLLLTSAGVAVIVFGFRFLKKRLTPQVENTPADNNSDQSAPVPNTAHDKKMFYFFYCGAFAICAFLWVAGFFA